MIMFWRGLYRIYERAHPMKFVIICKMQDSYVRPVCSRAVNWIIHLLARWWKDGDSRHTFYLPCDECTITFEDVALQLDLPVDGVVITGVVVVLGKENLCEAFLGKLSNKFQGGWIEVKWLQGNFKDISSNTIDVVKEQYA
ncbi:hypothetical protein PVK06_008177 [Gossypium arboreum]|uniref:Aminotransferase-like plant mobile domain-containing protein n=1 Tax=Gossypium arboreum TaxID=29729 RepID=A0ABR0QJA8_GOSAR|nr:hypothetical protein PVK06_008177 [Gossypium arboreum]